MTGHPTLRTKLLRDIRTQWPQFVAITVTVLLGVGLYAASYDAYRNLIASYNRVFDQERFADLFVTGGDVTTFAAAARIDPGVAAVATRTQADVPVRIGTHKLRGRIVGLPPNWQPAVNRVTVLGGSSLTGARDVFVEHHVAEHFKLLPGSTVDVLSPGGWLTVRVAGVVSSGEYLWPARSKQEPIPVPDDFGVLFGPEPLARVVAGEGPNQVLVRLAPGTPHPAVDLARLTRQAHAADAADVYTRAEQPSNALLHADITGFGELSVMFPLLFLTAAGLATYVLLTRRVQAERPIIGTLRACGTPRGTVLWHYLGYGLAAGLAGAIPGLVLGVASARWLTHLYVHAINLPEQSTVIGGLRPATVGAGLGFGVAAGVVATWAPARLAARVPPLRRCAPPRTSPAGAACWNGCCRSAASCPLRSSWCCATSAATPAAASSPR